MVLRMIATPYKHVFSNAAQDETETIEFVSLRCGVLHYQRGGSKWDVSHVVRPQTCLPTLLIRVKPDIFPSCDWSQLFCSLKTRYSFHFPADCSFRKYVALFVYNKDICTYLLRFWIFSMVESIFFLCCLHSYIKNWVNSSCKPLIMDCFCKSFLPSYPVSNWAISLTRTLMDGDVGFPRPSRGRVLETPAIPASGVVTRNEKKRSKLVKKLLWKHSVAFR